MQRLSNRRVMVDARGRIYGHGLVAVYQEFYFDTVQLVLIALFRNVSRIMVSFYYSVGLEEVCKFGRKLV